MCLAIDVFQVPPPRTTARRTTFCGGEIVRHYGEPAVVIKFSRRRGLRLRALDGSHGWYAEPEECEPLY
jgi:hypothetical protein